MEFLQTNLKKFICKDFRLLSEKNEAHLKEKVKAASPKSVFIQQNEHIYRVNEQDDVNHLIFSACREISIHTDLATIIDYFADFDTLLVHDQGRYIGYLHDTTFFKQLAKAHLEVQAYFQTVLDTIDTSCTVIDANENVLIWTEGAEKIFSVKQPDILGQPIRDFFQTNRLALLQTLKDGTSLKHSQHQAREDLVVLINSKPVYLHDKIIGAVVSETDITSQIKLNNELHQATEKVFHLEKEVSKLKLADDPFKRIRGNSSALKQTLDMTKKAATTETNILIYGESGVGKELFAKAVHNIREGENAPFVAINCGAIPFELFESEIFGYEKGAFSGAHQKGKKGKVELAKGGTLFLDEIGEMPLEMQVKILRLLQERKFYPVGGTKEIEVDFRVVAATNRDLKELIREGKFREDLYYRLNVVSLEIPPLRKRPEDIIELTHYFLYEISIKYNRPIHGISQEVMQALLSYDWPGNIRELKNVVERLVVFSEEGEIKKEVLPFEVDHMAQASNGKGVNASIFSEKETRSLAERLQELEREIILKELKKTNGEKLSCAKNLQITRATLYNRMKKLGIKP
ncbi:sigma-54 interaction domain-containing protein [Virgibacillus alimentarius]|uniref:Transcriptional regulator with PAS, ATPase and Fis domain n=1 Tax=Virgibacillus alimentarius TaxID=698769 RepID=A0ABS4S9S8_9BACI|nr:MULTISPECIES: sigma 54-interacting transcriptional regulator [Virgibacillus]MBP2258077.1 transcriptional regulator with PAS, ATPase and Fis domain [Virgibacillus alimentarius]HLR67087.1 sigma 54-interacting transcriptional regulator [Virgibacillus sp.]